DEGPRERLLQRVVRARLVQPRPRGDDAAGPDLQELAELLPRERVVLDRRDEHPPVARADPFETLVAQPGEEPADHRPDAALVRILEDVERGENLGLGHGQIARSRPAQYGSRSLRL